MKQKLLIFCSSLLMMAFFLFPQNEVQANPETPVELECRVEQIPCPPGSDYTHRQICHAGAVGGISCSCGAATVCNDADFPKPKDAVPGG